MTSTSVFKGSFGEKPSSRVIRPPGGGSSNIFGVPEVKPAPAPIIPAAQPASEEGSANVVSSSSLDNPPHTADVKPNKEHTPAAVVETKVQKDDSCSYKPKKQQSGFNPITGEPYGQTEAAGSKQQNSIAVKQPPGGASTKLW